MRLPLLVVIFLVAFSQLGSSQEEELKNFRGLKWGSSLRVAKKAFPNKEFYDFRLKDDLPELKAQYFYDSIFEKDARVYLLFVKGKFLKAEVRFLTISAKNLIEFMSKVIAALKQKYGDPAIELSRLTPIWTTTWKFKNANVITTYDDENETFVLHYATSEYADWSERTKLQNESRDKTKF